MVLHLHSISADPSLFAPRHTLLNGMTFSFQFRERQELCDTCCHLTAALKFEILRALSFAAAWIYKLKKIIIWTNRHAIDGLRIISERTIWVIITADDTRNLWEA